MSDRQFPGIQALRTSALAALDTVTDEAGLAALRTHLFGRKAGAVVELMKEMRNIAPEDRPIFGQAVNDLKAALEARIDAIDATFKARAEAETLVKERIDVTLPGEKPFVGATHVLTQTVEEMSAIFSRLGFTVRLGPEVELDTYNFEALNIPQGHPARDMQDTFYIGADTVLRTQTSPVQIRTMLTEPLPIQIIAPGAVYRNDDDATHSPRFHQMEGLYIGEGITFANLKGTLDYFLNEFFGSGTRVRFRPSYFPFTEPSAEADIGCVFCGGDGCRVCSHTGWLEVLGCGMVDPRVLRGCGIDDERYTGWAFGLGIDRLAMLKHGIDNIRILFQNDVRFLEQFRATT